MNKRHTLTTVLGKTVRQVARLRGGGSALPGLFVEKIDPDFVARTLKHLPRGIAIISGTNGKTTTTKMVVELLRGQGLNVFTNRTGSNFTRGVAAALLSEVDIYGNLDADIAVLELDEAYAVHFVHAISPNYCLLLNVMRDQLDRFGEIDATAKLLHTVAAHATNGVVVNRDDPRLGSRAFAIDVTAPIRSYGVHPDLQSLFPSDDNLRGAGAHNKHVANRADDGTTLESVDGQRATISFSGNAHAITLSLHGIYNVLNATGAIALTRMIMGDELDTQQMLDSLSRITPAFGRGEQIMVSGQPCELVLVKNPAGFRLSLASFNPDGYATMIAVNDNYADGRDMSWLWDVDFDSLRAQGVAELSGVRAYDMALRLQYELVEISHVEPDLAAALKHFISTNPNKPKRIYCTYTAMLRLRRELAKCTTVEEIA